MSRDVKQTEISKTEAMDKLIASCTTLHSHDIINIVSRVFSIRLDIAPLLRTPHSGIDNISSLTPQAALEASLAHFDTPMTGVQVRQLINQLFGINLDAISALGNARISLYSKGQWILQHPKDLFVVSTGEGDVDVTIKPADYFVEITQENLMPKPVRNQLLLLGYRVDPEGKCCYYFNPTGDAVSDAFKGKTFQALLAAISRHYFHL